MSLNPDHDEKPAGHGGAEHEKRMQDVFAMRKMVYKTQNKQLLCRFNLASLVITVGLACYTFLTVQTEGVPNSCPGENVEWFLYLVLAMHFTNILQAVCDITELEHCFCSKSKNFWLDIYEVATVLLMQWVLFNANYCEGVGQFYICLLVNTSVYWVLLIANAYFFLRAHCCFNVSEEECEKIVHAEEQRKLEKKH